MRLSVIVKYFTTCVVPILGHACIIEIREIIDIFLTQQKSDLYLYNINRGYFTIQE